MIAKDNIWMRRALVALYGDVEVGHQPIGQMGQKPPIGSERAPIGPIVPIGQSSRPEIGPGPDEAVTADFEERAGIAENDGGLSRPHAEVLAALSVAPGPIDQDARAKVIDCAARFLERKPRT